MNNKLVVYPDRVEIHIDRSDMTTRLLIEKNLYPFHVNRIRTIYKVSIRKIPEVLALLRHVDESNIDTAPEQIINAYYAEMSKRAKQVFGDGNPKVTDSLTLMRHQQYARELAKVYDRFGLFYDTRTGKTPTSLAIINDDLQEHPDHKWLVVCPLILMENAWMEDAKDFVPDIKVVKCHATTKEKRLKEIAKDASIYILNTESFVAYIDYFKDKKFTGCIVDESSSMKSSSSKIGEALVEFSQTVKRWYLLSGTPAPNGEWEYYKQLQSIDYYCVPQSYSQFKARYFVNVSRNPQYDDLVLRGDTKDELISIIQSNCIYADKADVLTLPGREFKEVEYTMLPSAKTIYKDMKNKMAVELQDEVTITAVTAAAKYNKLNQLASGILIDTRAVKENQYNDSDLTEWYEVDNGRKNQFKKILKHISKTEPNAQIVVWANYKSEFRILEELVDHDCVILNGEVSAAEKVENIRKFKNGKVRFLIANPASADKGLTLTNAHIAIYFSLNFSYEKHKQSMDRIYADIMKQPNKCTYYILLAEHTINGPMYREVLQGKENASYAILNHIRGDFNAAKDC